VGSKFNRFVLGFGASVNRMREIEEAEEIEEFMGVSLRR
jgi:hypothetical protein